MTITRRLMKPGQFSVSLKPGTPKSIMKAIDKFDHVVITRNRLLPIDAYSDANVLAQSLYTGVIEELSRTGNSLAGFDLSYWLGTPDGRGDLLDTAVSRTSGTLQDWIGDLRPASLSAGTVTNTGTNLTNTYQWVSRREAIDAVCRSVGAEWRVNPNGTLDAAAPATLFTATPEIVITRNPQGNDGAFRGIEVGAIGTSESVATYITKAIVVGDGLATGSATGSTTYKDLLNGNAVFESLIAAPAEADPSAVATAVLAERNTVRRELTMSSRSYNVTRFVEPGDWVYAWDEQGDLVDQANQITYNGRLISPIALRVYSVTFPLEEGLGVYVRRSGATPSYTDVTDWVEWESGDVRWEVGATALPSVQLAKGTAYLGANPDALAQARLGLLSAPPRAEATSAVVQSIADSTVSPINFASENYDTDAIHDNAVNNFRLTVPTGLGGLWRVSYSLFFAAGGVSGIRASWVRKNAGSVRYGWEQVSTNLAGTFSGSAEIELAAGDYVDLVAFQVSGGALNYKDATVASLFRAVRVGD